MPDKFDFKKTYKELYSPKKTGFHIVDVPELKFIMVDGKGDPSTSHEYQAAVEAIYTLSYGIKFAYKPKGFDHAIPPLEGLW